MIVRKAIVLAAGLGTRLRPFTCVTPKPLMPVWGEPMLLRVVEMLRGWGVNDITINAHYLHEQIAEWAGDYQRNAVLAGDDVKIAVSYEPEILGTGGVLNPLRAWIGEEPFYLVNGDIVVEEAPNPISKVRDFASSDVIGCGLVSESGPRTIEVEAESKFVTCWKSPDPGYNGTFTFCGISVFKHEILNYVPKTGLSSIVEALETAMMEGKFFNAVTSDEMLWTDAGTIERYIDINQDGEDNAFADFPQVKAAQEAIGANSHISFVGARGSERVFFREGKGVIILYDDKNRVENSLYAAHARFLKEKGAPVPNVLADLPEMKTLVLGYAGTERSMSVDDYAEVVKSLVKFHALGEDPDLKSLKLMPPFDADSWAWEKKLFCDYCLTSRFQRSLPAAVEAELKRVAEILENESKALVHRDFQSTNILWKGNVFSFIDFQGMRLGPGVYDLASLLYDPYVTFTDKQRQALAALYAKEAGREDITKILPFAAVQRLIQCLGAYGRLASVGQRKFEKYIMPALQNLLTAADEAGLDATGALAEDLIAS